MPTFVTKPFLPPLTEFQPYLEKIWDRRILSNGGPFHIQLEEQLCEALKVKHISLFTNATIALLVAFRALDLKDAEIITTPYSFIATSSTLLWSGHTPVFVDIEPDSTNIDPSKIEKAITKKTKAILAVHCYGHPCKTDLIKEIAVRYGLKVIYDAAHAFGIETSSGSLLNQGDLSILSFHATKVFNTFEGGAIVCDSPEMKTKIDRLKNFGIVDELNIENVGINAKMSEFNSALGLLQLKYYKSAVAARSKVDQAYRLNLEGVRGIDCLKNKLAQLQNFSYFPILVNSDYSLSRDQLYDFLKSHDIFTRRYFYPLISEFPIYKDLPSSNSKNLPIASIITQQILCLPIYPELELSTVNKICELIISKKK